MLAQDGAPVRPDAAERVKGRPVGGFVLISVVQLAMAWWAYRTGAIRLRDLRVWFALWEMREERCRLKAGRVPNYRTAEVLKLVGGVGEPGIRSALRRLERVGLAKFSSSSISFAVSPDELRVEDVAGLFAMLEKVELTKRRVPMPRRTLLFLAGGARRAVIATVLGVLMRCLFARRDGCVSGGRCKASWVADTFGVDLRRVKAARRHLENIGWLSAFQSEHWKENRWGRGVVVNLEWSRESALSREPLATTANFSTSGLPPHSGRNEPGLPPPCLNQTLPSELKNQKPRQGASGPGSFRLKTETKKELPAPRLSHVLLEDLRNGERLLALFEQAESLRFVNGSENSRLQFFAAAEHAAVIGSVNPPGLFARLVRRGWWHYATLSDEDAARIRLKKLLLGDVEEERERSFARLDDEAMNAPEALRREMLEDVVRLRP